MSVLSLRYAHAFASVAASAHLDAAAAQQQLDDFGGTLAGSRELREVLMNPSIATDQKLKVLDAELFADMFLSMIQGSTHLKRLLGIGAPLTKKQMQSRVRYAVDLFLTAHAI